MSQLPTDLYNRCRSTLLKCSEFESDRSLRAVFVTAELSPFQSGLPQAASEMERVDVVLDYLLKKFLSSDGQPVLPFFLWTLREKYEPNDALHDELGAVAEAVQSVLSPLTVSRKQLYCIALNKQGNPCSSHNLEPGDQLCRDHLNMILSGKEVKDYAGNLISVDIAKRQKRRQLREKIRRLLFGWYSTEKRLVILATLSIILLAIVAGIVKWPSIRPLVFKEPTFAPTSIFTPPPTLTPKPLADTPAAPGEIAIVIARFYGAEGYGVQRRISSEIKKELEAAKISNVRIIDSVADTISPDQKDFERAVKELGDTYNATAVIWGWMDKGGFTPNFTITSVPEFFFPKPQLQEVATIPEQSFQLYIQKDLPAQMAYFTSWTVAQIHFWREQFEQASNMLDRALEEAKRAKTNHGLEQIYLYRGLIEAEIRQRPEQAIVEYSQGISINPNLGDLYNNRGNAYFDLGRYLEAIADFTRAISVYKEADKIRDYASYTNFINHSYAYNNRCIAYSYLEDFDQAIDDCSKAIELQMGTSDVPNPLVNRGWVYWQLDDFDAALADFKMAVEYDPQDAEAYVLIGELYENSNDLEQAKSWYERAISVDPKYSDAYLQSGQVYEKQDKDQEALQEYGRAILADPKNADAYQDRGNLYEQLGQEDEALADYIQVLVIEQNAYETFDVCQRLNRCQEVISQLQDLVTQSDDPRSTHIALGHLYVRMEEFEKAIREFSIALESKATPDVYLARASTYLEVPNAQAAVDDYTAAIALSPGDKEAYEGRSKAYEQLGRFDKALEDRLLEVRLAPRENYTYGQIRELCERIGTCQKVLGDLAVEITRTPFDPNIYLILAQLNQELGKDEEAIDYYTDFLEVDQDDIWVQEKRAELLVKVSRLDEAIAEYTLILQHRPQAADIYNARANVYERQEEYQLALADYNKASEIDPKNEETLSARAALYEKLGKANLGTVDFVTIVSATDYISSYDIDKLIEYCQKHDTCQQAIDELAKISAPNNKSKASIYYALGRLYKENNQLTQALANFNEAIKLVDDQENFFSARAHIYEQLGEYAQATGDYVTVLTIDRYILTYRIDTLIEKCQKYNTCYQAISQLSRIIQDNPSRALMYFYRGRTYEETNQLTEALADYNKGIALVKDEEDIFIARARVYEKLHEYTSVVADCDKILEIAKSVDRSIYIMCATVYEKQGNKALALENYVTATLMGAFSPDSMNKIVRLCKELNSCQTVLAHLEKIAEQDPISQSVQVMTGIILSQLGDDEAALAAFDNAIKLGDSKEAYAGRAEIYRKKGQNLQATRDYVNALSDEWIYSPAIKALIQTCEVSNTCQEAIKLLNQWITAGADKQTVMKSFYFQSLIYAALEDSEREMGAYINLLSGYTTDSWYASELIRRCKEMSGCQVALNQLDKAIASVKDNTMLYYTRGRLHSELGSYNTAVRDFDTIIERDPKFSNTYELRGEAYNKLQMPREAIQDYVQAIAYTSSSSWLTSKVVNLCRESNLYEFAINTLNIAISTSPKNGWLYYARGRLYMEQNDLSSAVDDFNQAIDIDVTESTWFEARAEAYAKLSKNTAALEDYLQVISLSTSPYARNKLVQFCEKANMCAEALVKLTNSIQGQPGNSQVLLTRAEIYVALNNTQAALKDYDRAVELALTDASIYNSRAKVREATGDFAGALADYIKNVSLEVSNTSTAEDIIKLCQELDSCEQVIEQVSALLETNEKKASLLFTRGRLHEFLEENEKAINDFSEAIDANETNIARAAYLRRATLYERKKNFEKAVEDYSVLIEDYSSTEAYYYRGLAYKQLGKTGLALQDFQTYLKTNPPAFKRDEVEEEIKKLTQ